MGIQKERVRGTARDKERAGICHVIRYSVRSVALTRSLLQNAGPTVSVLSKLLDFIPPKKQKFPWRAFRHSNLSPRYASSAWLTLSD